MKNKTVISMTRHHWDMKFDQDKASHRIKRPSGRIIQTEENLSSQTNIFCTFPYLLVHAYTQKTEARVSSMNQEELMRNISLVKMW